MKKTSTILLILIMTLTMLLSSCEANILSIKKNTIKITNDSGHNNVIVGVSYWRVYSDGHEGWHCTSRDLYRGESITFYTNHRTFYYIAYWNNGEKKWFGNEIAKCDNYDGDTGDKWHKVTIYGNNLEIGLE